MTATPRRLEPRCRPPCRAPSSDAAAAFGLKARSTEPRTRPAESNARPMESATRHAEFQARSAESGAPGAESRTPSTESGARGAEFRSSRAESEALRTESGTPSTEFRTLTVAKETAARARWAGRPWKVQRGVLARAGHGAPRRRGESAPAGERSGKRETCGAAQASAGSASALRLRAQRLDSCLRRPSRPCCLPDTPSSA